MEINEHDLNNDDLSVYKFPTLAQATNVMESISTYAGIQDVQLKSLVDDGGVVEGSFINEYKDAEEPSGPNALERAMGNNEGNNGLGKQPVVWQDVTLMMFRTTEAQRLPEIEEVIREGGGRELHEGF